MGRGGVVLKGLSGLAYRDRSRINVRLLTGNNGDRCEDGGWLKGKATQTENER